MHVLCCVVFCLCVLALHMKPTAVSYGYVYAINRNCIDVITSLPYFNPSLCVSLDMLMVGLCISLYGGRVSD